MKACSELPKHAPLWEHAAFTEAPSIHYPPRPTRLAGWLAGWLAGHQYNSPHGQAGRLDIKKRSVTTDRMRGLSQNSNTSLADLIEKYLLTKLDAIPTFISFRSLTETRGHKAPAQTIA